jgi:hypothetical protein
MLPAKIPNARILTYDWNASYDKNVSTQIFLGEADQLLDDLYDDRKSEVCYHQKSGD